LIVPLNCFATVRCTEASSLWRIKSRYIAPDAAFKVQLIFLEGKFRNRSITRMN